MTGKDFIKILLCSYGYDRNIKVETYNGDYGAPGYEVAKSTVKNSEKKTEYNNGQK